MASARSRTLSAIARILTGLVGLAWTGIAAAGNVSTEPPAIAALRADHDSSAQDLRDRAAKVRDASRDPTESAWASLALAEFEHDLENADTALALLEGVQGAARELGYTDLLFAALLRQATILVNRGKSAETQLVLDQLQALVDVAAEPDWRAKLLHERGVLERKLGRFAPALDYFEQALTIQRERNDKGEMARELNSIGMLHGRTGKFSDAVQAHNEALALARELKDRAETARGLRMLGVLYRNLDDEELGSEYLREALAHVSTRNRREAISLHGELSMSLTLLGRLDEAEAHATRAVTLAENSGSPPNKVNAYTRMAELLLERGELSQAKRWADRAFESFDAVAIRDQILLRITRARVWAALGDVKAALPEAQLVLEGTRRIGDRILERSALDLLADQQLASGDAASAFATQKAHQALDKELAMDMAARRIALLEVKLDRQRELAERDLLERDNQIQVLRLNRQRLVGIALVAGLLAMLAIAGLLYWRIREGQRSNAKLSASHEELARLHEALLHNAAELERLAHTDALTGVANRRAAALALETRLQRACTAQRPLSVLLLDLDLFKQINDRYGHLAGDEVLRQTSARIRAVLPAGAALGRWGGEEFIAILDDCSQPSAVAIAESLRLAIAAQAVRFEDVDIAVTASFGVAHISGLAAANVDALVAAADHALYRAKRGGRNRVEVADHGG